MIMDLKYKDKAIHKYGRSIEMGFAEGENRLCAAGPFCSPVNVFLHYQQALRFPEACALMGLDKERNMK